ncbi:hypothetical protein PHLCEN_2v11322 [Hermanssonia centrifuga]|uniref:Uncharacterized protein n=1 Tax=Hermanssonia centrifuga TaxID=98765 RepID=A0A2R6NKB4_9APHY|nr:hypothetical protein PHLCEN_2v11322 [Hermanssonia centrifuga]
MEQQTQIGRTYPVDGVSHRDSAPAFAVAESDSPSTSQPASVPANHSHPSSTRSSPRDRHANMMDSRGRMQASAVADGNPRGSAAWHAHNQAQYTRAAAAGGTTPRSGGGRGLQPQQSLPSLKASGLLDSWKPPTDGFGQPMSISKEDERAALMMQHSRSHSASRAAQPLYPTT